MELAREQNVRLVSVNYKDQRPAALRWLEERGDPYEITFEDAAGDFGLDLGVFGAPETYLVDSNGIIRARHVGVLDESGWAELKPQYEALLAQAQQGVAQ
jgi:cytochrome c biogenesis protein CcmG/thiol:disulfide interchange protein DsbE